MAAEATHALVEQGAGSAAAGDTTIGSIELPTRGQPWTLHNFFGQMYRQTATAAEAVVGHMRINSASGDVTPQPNPSIFPLKGSGSFLGATAPVTTVPLHNYPLDLRAAGKADLDLIGNNAIAATAAPKFILGVAFGPGIPAPRPAKFANRARTTVTAAARGQVGTITLSEGATRIVAILGRLTQDGVLVAGEELGGFFDLSSEDVDLVPLQLGFNEVYGAGLGTTIGGGEAAPPMPHLVDIPVPGGARIDCFVTLNTAVTNGADVEIFIMYE